MRVRSAANRSGRVRSFAAFSKSMSPTPTEEPIESTTAMNEAPPESERHWERHWWKPAKGQSGVFAYLIAIHVLALTGLILFPLPGWKVFTWLLVLGAISIVWFLFGYFVFNRLRDTFAEEV